MPIDFFIKECHHEIAINRFGLCDDVDLPGERPTPAYAKPYQEEDWIATVENNRDIPITFTAIDHCVIADSNTPRSEACDCMLTYETVLIFVELKVRRSRSGDWQDSGLNQLFVTINLFKELHGIKNFTIRKAYLSNKVRPAFPIFKGVEKNRFEDNTGFDLYTETIILIN